MIPIRVIDADVLVVGAGGAGCRAAIAAKQTDPAHTVVVALKGRIGESGSTDCFRSVTHLFGAALASPSNVDSAEQHFLDTCAAGLGMEDEYLTRILAYEAPERLKERFVTRIGAGKERLDS